MIPKGFFPTQDTGIIIGITDVAQDASYHQMATLQGQVDQLAMKDPAVATVVSSIGAGAGGQTANNGRMYITLKPWSERSDNVTQVIARLDKAMQGVNGVRLFLQPAQDVSVGARLGRTLFQYTLEDPDQKELNVWAPKILAKMQQLALLADVTSDQENLGTTETLTYDRDQASRFGILPGTIDNILYDAFGQREVAQYFTGNKAYYVILEAEPNEFGKLSTLDKLYVQSSTRHAGSALDDRAPDNRAGAAPGDQPSKPVPVRHGVVQPQGQCLAGRCSDPGAAGRSFDGGSPRRCRAASRGQRRRSKPR